VPRWYRRTFRRSKNTCECLVYYIAKLNYLGLYAKYSILLWTEYLVNIKCLKNVFFQLVKAWYYTVFSFYERSIPLCSNVPTDVSCTSQIPSSKCIFAFSLIETYLLLYFYLLSIFILLDSLFYLLLSPFGSCTHQSLSLNLLLVDSLHGTNIKR
jgi:hypothetical protein